MRIQIKIGGHVILDVTELALLNLLTLSTAEEKFHLRHGTAVFCECTASDGRLIVDRVTVPNPANDPDEL